MSKQEKIEICSNSRKSEVQTPSPEIIAPTELFIKNLVGTVSKVDVFSNDTNDEFRVLREDGTMQGIFKCWAVPVIPFLESDNLETFSNALSKPGSFWEKIDGELLGQIETWSKNMSDKPTKLWQTLERWRGFSETYDRRLHKIFLATKLPENKDERAAELYLRLITAFGFAAPFYHLEAIVGDGNTTRFNPLMSKEVVSIQNSGGTLDLIAMAMPSALSNKVVVDKLDWKGMNWQKLNELSKFDPKDEESILAFRIARMLGVEIADIVFAANVLQWIPASVGGKKGDLTPSEARDLINNALQQNRIADIESVGRNLNALIRFFNWLPLVNDEENFTGKGWRYAAVCDTSDILLSEFGSGGLLNEDFEQTFKEKVLDQIKHLDAASARGRFILQILNEGKVKSGVAQLIKERSSSFFTETAASLVRSAKHEEIKDVLDANPRFLVGGKAAGLHEAGIIFGPDSVIPGIVITTEVVENWLRSKPIIWSLIKRLDLERDITKKLEIAKKITSDISKEDFPTQCVFDRKPDFLFTQFAVRSSSFDEDTDVNGTAAGIYESVVPLTAKDAGKAISSVVASFFSEKAVSYRSLHGLSDKPIFSVIVSPFIEGPGGIVFSSGNGGSWEMVVGERSSEIARNSSSRFDSFKREGPIFSEIVNSGWIDKKTVEEIGEMVLMAETALGERADIEFVVDKTGKPWILQLRSIKREQMSKNASKNVHLTEIRLDSLEEIETTKKIKNVDDIRLIVGENINIEQFQGVLFRYLIINRGKVKEIVLPKRIPRTGHFANICLNLGIKLSFTDE